VCHEIKFIMSVCGQRAVLVLPYLGLTVVYTARKTYYESANRTFLTLENAKIVVRKRAFCYESAHTIAKKAKY